MKKLPKIFQAPMDQVKDHNDKVFYSSYQNGVTHVNTSSITMESNKSVEEEIDALFKSSSYIFNIPVLLTTKNGSQEVFLAGKTKYHLLTLENEKIPIADIISFKRKDR